MDTQSKPFRATPDGLGRTLTEVIAKDLDGFWTVPCAQRKNPRGHARPTLDKLCDCLLEIEAEVLPKSPKGRAARYTLTNWTALTRFSGVRDLEIRRELLMQAL